MSLTTLAKAAGDATSALNAVSKAAGKLSKAAVKAQDAALGAIFSAGKLSDSQLKLINQISQMSVGFYSGTGQLINLFQAADNLKKAYHDSDVASIIYWQKQIDEINGVINTWLKPFGIANVDARQLAGSWNNGGVRTQWGNTMGGSRQGTQFGVAGGGAVSAGGSSGSGSTHITTAGGLTVSGSGASHVTTAGGSTISNGGLP